MGTNNTASVRPFVDDNDGISAAVENAGPNSGDGNNDGTLDSEQPNVVSFLNPVTNKYVTIEANSACSITSASSAAESANDDKAYSYPVGLTNYSLNCGTAGFSTSVTIYYHGLTSTNGMVVRKYNPTTNTYTTIAGAVISGSSPVTVTYTLTDGGALDADGVANGIIVDPIGLALPQVTTPNTGLKSQNLFMYVIIGALGLILVGVAAIIVSRPLKQRA
jgi:hypothetical protein